jgi:hypothetical protein
MMKLNDLVLKTYIKTPIICSSLYLYLLFFIEPLLTIASALQHLKTARNNDLGAQLVNQKMKIIQKIEKRLQNLAKLIYYPKILNQRILLCI